MSPEPWSRRLRRALLDHLWGQWSAVGVAGYGGADHRIIDPEALLLCSLEQARWDARLFDVILDWCGVNGAFLAIPRLKALRRHHPVTRQLAALAEISHATNGGSRWKALLEPDHVVANPEPLFFTLEGAPLPQVGPPDPIFLRQGMRREVYTSRGQARPFPPEEPAALILSLRALMGSSARCEILAQLIDGQEQTPSQLARQTGYSQKNIQDAMVDMARSGHVVVRSAGREKRYRLEKAFRQLVGGGKNLTSYPWMTLYPLVSQSLALLAKSESLGLAETSIHPKLSQLLNASQPALLEGGMRPEHITWNSTEAFVTLLLRLLAGEEGIARW